MKNLLKTFLFFTAMLFASPAQPVSFSGFCSGVAKFSGALKMAWQKREEIQAAGTFVAQNPDMVTKLVKVVQFVAGLGAFKGSLLVASVIWLVYIACVLVKEALWAMFKFCKTPLGSSVKVVKWLLQFILSNSMPFVLLIGGRFLERVINRKIDSAVAKIPGFGPFLVPASR